MSLTNDRSLLKVSDYISQLRKNFKKLNITYTSPRVFCLNTSGIPEVIQEAFRIHGNRKCRFVTRNNYGYLTQDWFIKITRKVWIMKYKA